MAKNRTRIPSMSIRGENVIGVLNASGSARVRLDQQVIHHDSADMEKLFKRLHRELKKRPEDPNVSKEKLEAQVRKIEAEAAKGEGADTGKLERWMKTLVKMAPDIVEVMAASLGGPVAGFSVVFKKIVERVRAASVKT